MYDKTLDINGCDKYKYALTIAMLEITKFLITKPAIIAFYWMYNCQKCLSMSI